MRCGILHPERHSGSRITTESGNLDDHRFVDQIGAAAQTWSTPPHERSCSTWPGRWDFLQRPEQHEPDPDREPDGKYPLKPPEMTVRWEKYQRTTRADSSMENIPRVIRTRISVGDLPANCPSPAARWKISQRTARTDGSMGDISASHAGREVNGKYLSALPDRRLNGRNPRELPELRVRWEISQRATRAERSMGDIPAGLPDRGSDGRNPSALPGSRVEGRNPSRLTGPRVRGEISQQADRIEGSMGDIPAGHPDRGLDGRDPSGLPGPRGFDGKYHREPPGPRVRWERSPRATQVEGSLQDFPTGPGIGPSAASTRSPRLGCSLRQAGEARPGFCREVKRRTKTPPPRRTTAA